MSVKSVFSNKPKLNTLSYALISLFSILFLAILIFTIFSFLKQPKKAVLGVRVSVSEQDAIPHPDFKDKNFYACVIGNLNEEKINNKTDRTFNHLATTEELTSLKSLDCGLSFSAPQSQKITDATGLDKLPNLTLLDLHYNQLAAIDVSKNIALTKLYLGSNQLTAIDISENTALISLDLSSNQLTTLDVPKNTALTILNLSYNQLTTLDVSKNTALINLYLFNNKLTSLGEEGVSKNTALTKLDLRSNQLTTIDISKNTALKELYLYNNKLTSLGEEGVSKNTALTSLSLDKNQLTTIDISKNTALTKLDLSSNQLTTINVSKNTTLKELYLYNNKLTSLGEEGVSKNTALTNLFLYNNQLTTIKGLDKTNKLNYLSLYSNSTKIFFTTINSKDQEDKLAITDKYIFLNAGYKINSTNLPLDKIRYALKNTYDSNSTKLTTTFTDINNIQLSNDSLIKNGDYIQVNKGDEVYGAQFIVLGDTTGDGKVQSNDVIKAYRYYKQSQQDPNSLDFLSADVTHDGKVQSNDVIKIYRYYKGTLDSLW